MPPENKPTANQKQKITIVAVVLVLAVVVWQGLKLFGGDSGSSPLSPVATGPARTTSNQITAPTGGNGAVASAASQESLAPKQVPVQGNAEILKVQLDTQAKYIASLNELEMLKVQKEIADTKEAITAATLATATAEKSITDLLTVQQLPNAVANAYSPTVVSESNTSGTPTIPIAPKPAAPPPEVSPFTLMSVSFKAERWSAVLSAQNKFYNVTVGEVLPLDNSVVTEIDRNGVTVMLKDKQTKRITMIPEL